MKPASAPAAKPAANSETALALTLGEILDLYNIGIGNAQVGQLGLNGYEKAVGERPIVNPYSLTKETRQKITKAKFKLRPYFEEMDRELRSQTTIEVMGSEAALVVPREDQVRQAEWHQKYNEALKAVHTVEGLPLFEAEEIFQGNKNPIPNEVELALGPIIKGSPWREKNVPDTAAAAPAEPSGGEPG